MKSDRLWHAVITIAAAVITAYAGYWFGRQPEAVSEIEYRMYSEENLTRQLGRSEDFKITYKGVERPGLSRVEIFIANTSARNLEKMRVYLHLSDVTVTPLISDFSVPEGYPRDLIKRISQENGTFTYEIDYMNRTARFSSGFSFYFYFAQATPPQVSIELGAKGVTLRRYNRQADETSPFKFWLMVWGDLWWVIVLWILLTLFALKSVRTVKKIRLEKAKRYVASLLPAELTETERDKQADQAANKLFADPKLQVILSRLFKRE